MSGGLLLGASKLVFLVAGYVTFTTLAWLLEDDPDVYGSYNVVARLIAVPNMVLIQTLLFSVSRPLAGQHDVGFPAYASLRRRGIKVGLLLGAPVCLVFLIGADLLAGLLRDEALAPAIRVVSPICLIYALYAVNIGTLNATRRFAHQASLDMFMAVAKSALIITLAAVGFGLATILAGFTGAAALALLLSIGLVVKARPTEVGLDPNHEAPPLARFAGVLIAFTLIVNLLQAADLLLVKRLAEDPDAVGYYSGAVLISLVPYSLMNAVALILFPLIATLHSVGDREKARRYVTETVKLCFLLLCFMSVVGSACAREILALIFPPAYTTAATHLQHLVWGFAGYSFTITAAWMLNGDHRSRPALLLVALPLVVVVTGTLLAVPSVGTLGAAQAVAVAGGLGAAAALGTLYRVFGSSLPLTFAAKVLLATALVAVVGYLWSVEGRALILVKLTALSVLFLTVVAVTRAITKGQLQDLRRAGARGEESA